MVWVPAPGYEKVFRKSLMYPFVSSVNLLNHLVRLTVSYPLYRWQNKTREVNMLKFIARKLNLPDIRSHGAMWPLPTYKFQAIDKQLQPGTQVC